MKIEIEVNSCSECPLRSAGSFVCNEIYDRTSKVVDLVNLDIIPDFCPFKVHEYQTTEEQ